MLYQETKSDNKSRVNWIQTASIKPVGADCSHPLSTTVLGIVVSACVLQLIDLFSECLPMPMPLQNCSMQLVTPSFPTPPATTTWFWYVVGKLGWVFLMGNAVFPTFLSTYS